jgi:hypothetical protein
MFGKKKQKEEKPEEKEQKSGEKPKDNQESEKQKNESIKEKISKGYLKVHLIFEVVGKPAEFIDETIQKLVTELEKEKGVEVLEKKIGTAKPYEIKTETGEKTDLFSAFAETEVIIENLKRLITILFDYMPSSIEVIDPEDIKMNIQDANLILNELAIKLHKYDLSNKQLVFQRNVLFEKLKEAKEKK